jgi:hypothetical protein
LLVAFSIPSGLLSCFPDYRIALPNNIPVLITEINFNQPTGVTLFCVDFLAVTNFSLQLKTGKKKCDHPLLSIRKTLCGVRCWRVGCIFLWIIDCGAFLIARLVLAAAAAAVAAS